MSSVSDKVAQPPRITKRLVVGAGLLSIVSAVIIATFVRWVQSYDRVYFPAVESSRPATFPDGFILEGWLIAAAIVLTVTATVFLWLRLVPQLASVPINAWFSLSIGLAFPIAIYTSPTLALPFVASALAAVIVVLVRHRPVQD